MPWRRPSQERARAFRFSAADARAAEPRPSPVSSLVHPFASERGRHLLVADGSRIYDLDSRLDLEVRAARSNGDSAVEDLLARYGLGGTPRIDDTPLEDPPMRAISLAVAQKCNLGCAYCYARGGDFGAPSKSMPWAVARDSVLRLLSDAKAGDRVNVAFLGGEPLINRALIRQTTEF